MSNGRTFAVVFGTRPEAIKLAPVIRELERRGQRVVKISTGQHQSMLWQALAYFGIQVDHDLGAMREGQSLPDLVARITADCGALFRELRPDIVVVQGDTATAFGAALAAYLERIDIAHVEAGLRTFDDENPFPEEANRALIGRVARWHFCPTETARRNLACENVKQNVYVTGNTIVDTLQWALSNGTVSRAELALRLDVAPEALQRFVLVTSHRRENFGTALADICSAVCELENSREDLTIVWPVHLNPRVRQQVSELVRDCGPRLLRVEPLEYEWMLALLQNCTFILTDSGGIQEEAAFFHRPVLIMRKVTERPEIVRAGGGVLVGTDPHTILSAANSLLDDERLYGDMTNAPNPFGDGRAGERIVDVLTS